MVITPIEIFDRWFDEQLKASKISIPNACCLSTIGIDNYPNARFVSLKGIIENHFIVTGSLTSRKGIEISKTNKVALTFWWAETERQVRIQGNASIVSDQLADQYFSQRQRDSQIVSIVSDQGQEIDDIEVLNNKYLDTEKLSSNLPLTRPANWGGFSIEPIRIEFLEFRPTRFHHRKLYELLNGQWSARNIQP